MGSFVNGLENELLELILNNQDITLIGDAGGLLGSSTDGNLYVTLCSSDPTDACSSQSTNEISYTGYARASIARTGAAWTVTGNSASPASDITFGACTGGSATATHAIIGTASSGSGKPIWHGALSPSIAISSGVTPKIKTTSTITLD